MSEAPARPSRNVWARVSIGITAAIALVGAVAGFAWLPMSQPQGQFGDVWNAICSAAGLVYRTPAGEPPAQAAYRTTDVEVTPQMLRGAGAEAVGRGATLALRCSMCHGVQGLSGIPNLAGEQAIAIYKQLIDFQTGARASAVMRPLVTSLGDADMRDLAVYYAYLPRQPDARRDSGTPPRIVADGAPMRGIAPCGACHGTLESKAGAPLLGGQPASYLHNQLVAFASGARSNDISQQMRNVARAMTPVEIDSASQFYADQP
jgi:cytochrome c553